MDIGIGAGDGMGVKAGKAILGGGEVKVDKGVEVGLEVRVAMGRDVLVCFGMAVAVKVGCT